jgi:hypothetical protein
MPPLVPLFETLKEKKATLKLIKQVPDVAVYGFLLSTDLDDSLAEMVKKRWSELHHLTGERFLLGVFQPPAKWEASYRTYWRKHLGKDFDRIWREWQEFAGGGVAYDYLDLFKPKLKPSQLPCLVLFTDPMERKAVIRLLPKWDVESLYQLFIYMVEAIDECSDCPKERRLECLRKSLTSPSARTIAYFGYFKRKALDYLRKHPAKAFVTTASLVAALGTGSILPLAPGALEVLKALKKALGE